MLKLFSLLFLSILSMTVNAQKVVPLYPGRIPGAISTNNKEFQETIAGGVVIVHNITLPTLTIFSPPEGKSNGACVIICPGGGYFISAIKHEGYDVAKLLNKWGITAIVLKYRIPNDSTMINKSIGPLQDVQEAIKYVRDHEKNLQINKDKIGVMGFSAGGHLAANSGTLFNKSILNYPATVNLRPNFLILIYPVISFNSQYGHLGSRDNLIGKIATEQQVQYFSNELQVTPQTPPTFLVHAGNDDAVPVKNSIAFYEALQKNKVNASLNIYPGGGHGFGMHNPTTNDEWTERLKYWLHENKLIN